MDHVVTVRDIVEVGAIGVFFAIVAGCILWLVAAIGEGFSH